MIVIIDSPYISGRLASFRRTFAQHDKKTAISTFFSKAYEVLGYFNDFLRKINDIVQELDKFFREVNKMAQELIDFFLKVIEMAQELIDFSHYLVRVKKILRGFEGV